MKPNFTEVKKITAAITTKRGELARIQAEEVRCNQAIEAAARIDGRRDELDVQRRTILANAFLKGADADTSAIDDQIAALATERQLADAKALGARGALEQLEQRKLQPLIDIADLEKRRLMAAADALEAYAPDVWKQLDAARQAYQDAIGIAKGFSHAWRQIVYGAGASLRRDQDVVRAMHEWHFGHSTGDAVMSRTFHEALAEVGLTDAELYPPRRNEPIVQAYPVSPHQPATITVEGEEPAIHGVRIINAGNHQPTFHPTTHDGPEPRPDAAAVLNVGVALPGGVGFAP